ncbi:MULTISPECIES: aminotransferase class I/II-fold pyridoxal phosphate-dependent enzyme [Pseudomonas]|uniref:aminotransferase class I/II-fold pyridoxal phosphate-dependent enzyme n=1 Tax=Pseudomonas TaxID=286 RepID=UPI0015A05EDC|nr:aminotransferase class I/II-fold pyridoxal phosphate-dependent enzyme [Pseudomonas gingeri]NVZ28316.1 aminotransferase class I/II-fold pyridoxal phosphate-dependent enzyme [Pseudomonas gingeri]NVZ61927.1 aminotransferase class I/II-fold pyridoxal phosphate-dependent enzyme [Pseudomonas gingeri]NVZ79510.1 aminotransferase class I/II-fold pyridoxal phosphate-dependent enzyme [Pseudomonas gingeri]NWA09169.1 aminotransferase class I/II-fold pyridoxal phosphate-dependent enzyme [Pseudomonas ginge
MATLPDFRLETYFSKWEFTARYHMTASDAESMTLSELLALASDSDRAAFENLSLGYTQTYGAPALRETIAATYDKVRPSDILCFAGAEEGLYVAMQALLEKGDHAIVVTPNYQSAETIPLSLCEVTGVPLDPARGWTLDIDAVAAAIRPNTKLVSINFPHNPTGKILERERFDALVQLCRKHGLYLFSDEAYRLIGVGDCEQLPAVADVYERGLSLAVMSKPYGLPGLRIGWIACQDAGLLVRMERMKHYLSICNSGPSEILSIIALKARERILARIHKLMSHNLEVLDGFFAEFSERFDWYRPDGGCIAYPRYLGGEGVESFTADLVERTGVLLLPSSIYTSALGPVPTDRFRIGYGRANIEEGLEVFRRYLKGAA